MSGNCESCNGCNQILDLSDPSSLIATDRPSARAAKIKDCPGFGEAGAVCQSVGNVLQMGSGANCGEVCPRAESCTVLANNAGRKSGGLKLHPVEVAARKLMSENVGLNSIDAYSRVVQGCVGNICGSANEALGAAKFGCPKFKACRTTKMEQKHTAVDVNSVRF